MTTTTLRLPNRVDAEWGASWSGGKDNLKPTPEGIQCTFPKGEFASKGGVNFHSVPSGDVFPSDDVTLAYKVFIPDDFSWVKGGKLPGMWIGKSGSGGREWNDDGASSRLMWREEGKVVGYVYCCTDLGSYNGTPQSPLSNAQGKGFDEIAHHTNGAGIDIWRDEKKPLQLQRGQWNDVSLRVKLNSTGKTADGVLAVAVNGVSKQFDGMAWTKSPEKKKIEGIHFATWFGGGSKDYAPSKDMKLIFKNFTLESKKKAVPMTRRIINGLKSTFSRKNI